MVLVKPIPNKTLNHINHTQSSNLSDELLLHHTRLALKKSANWPILHHGEEWPKSAIDHPWLVTVTCFSGSGPALVPRYGIWVHRRWRALEPMGRGNVSDQSVRWGIASGHLGSLRNSGAFRETIQWILKPVVSCGWTQVCHVFFGTTLFQIPEYHELPSGYLT